MPPVSGVDNVLVVTGSAVDSTMKSYVPWHLKTGSSFFFWGQVGPKERNPLRFFFEEQKMHRKNKLRKKRGAMNMEFPLQSTLRLQGPFKKRIPLVIAWWRPL